MYSTTLAKLTMNVDKHNISRSLTLKARKQSSKCKQRKERG